MLDSGQSKRCIAFETLESRRVLTTVSQGWDGPGLGSAELTYHLENSPEEVAYPEVLAAIETALDAWSDEIDVEFSRTDQAGLRDSIDIRFVPLDGPGGTLAQAYFPDDVNPARIAGDIQFDVDDLWEVGNDLGREAFDLVLVAVHEIGHALGLEHDDHDHSVMRAAVSSLDQFTGLHDHDIEAALSLYAAAEPRQNSLPNSTIDPSAVDLALNDLAVPTTPDSEDGQNSEDFSPEEDNHERPEQSPETKPSNDYGFGPRSDLGRVLRWLRWSAWQNHSRWVLTFGRPSNPFRYVSPWGSETSDWRGNDYDVVSTYRVAMPSRIVVIRWR